MDINQVVIYEHIYELTVTYPNSDKKIGLTMGIRSASSEKCKAIMRKHTNDQANQNRSKQKRITAEVLEQNELEQTAASIAWWRWEKDDDGNEATYNGQKPHLAMDIAIEILGTVNWLYAQVKEAGQNLENFMSKGASESASILSNLSNTTAQKTSKEEPDANVTKLSAKAI